MISQYFTKSLADDQPAWMRDLLAVEQKQVVFQVYGVGHGGLSTGRVGVSYRQEVLVSVGDTACGIV